MLVTWWLLGRLESHDIKGTLSLAATPLCTLIRQMLRQRGPELSGVKLSVAFRLSSCRNRCQRESCVLVACTWGFLSFSLPLVVVAVNLEMCAERSCWINRNRLHRCTINGEGICVELCVGGGGRRGRVMVSRGTHCINAIKKRNIHSIYFCFPVLEYFTLFFKKWKHMRSHLFLTLFIACWIRCTGTSAIGSFYTTFPASVSSSFLCHAQSPMSLRKQYLPLILIMISQHFLASHFSHILEAQKKKTGCSPHCKVDESGKSLADGQLSGVRRNNLICF